MPHKKENLGIIGTGNMAEALIAGIRQNKVYRSDQIWGFDLNKKRLNTICQRYRIHKSASITEVCKRSSVILICVKPQQCAHLLDQIALHLKSHHLLLSIAAGINITFIEKRLPPYVKIGRIMPNTPCLIGKGASVFYLNKQCNSQEKKITIKIFGSVGFVAETKNENTLDAVTGLSGSGPAYVYFFTQALAKAGVTAGLDKVLAHKLAIQTVSGAASLLETSKESFRELIAQVTSKGGTTERGLNVLKKEKFEKIIEKCVKEATKRARELRK